MKSWGWLPPSAAVFIASFAAYLLTVCPTVYSGDSGDFITASYTLGVAHPTGYPLYMLLGKVFSLIPVGEVAYRYNLMSAFFAALTAVLVASITRSMTKSWAAGVGSALMAAFSQAVWDQATVAEAYSLHGFFIALMLWLVLKWREKRSEVGLVMVAVAFGFGLTNHVSLLFYAPAFAYLLLDGNKVRLSRYRYSGVFAGILAPLTLYLYIPLRAMADPVYNWGNPSSFGGFFNHVSGYVHRQTYLFTLTSEGFFERFFGILYHIARQYSVAGVLVLAGLYGWGGKNKAFLAFTAILLALDIAYPLLLNDVSLDITTFCIPSAIVLSVWAGFALSDILKWLERERNPRPWQQGLVAAVCIIVFASNHFISDRSRNYLAYDYAANILSTVEDNAVILAEGDNTVMPLSYLLHVAGKKPQVSMYERGGILSHKLYGQDFVYLGPREHEKRRYEKELSLVASGRPVYYTSDPDVMFPGYRTVQMGLVYKVVPESAKPAVKDHFREYSLRDVFNTTISLDYMSRNIIASYYSRLAEIDGKTDKDRALAMLHKAAEVLPDNMDIRYDAGVILLSRDDFAAAINEFKAALKINPRSAKSLNNLGYAQAMRGERNEARKAYSAALSIEPGYLKARFNLAGLLMTDNRLDEAAEQYRLILQQDPNYANAYLNLGVIYYRTSKAGTAASMWRRYLELEPGSPLAAEIRQKLDEAYVADTYGNDTFSQAMFLRIRPSLDDRLKSAALYGGNGSIKRVDARSDDGRLASLYIAIESSSDKVGVDARSELARLKNEADFQDGSGSLEASKSSSGAYLILGGRSRSSFSDQEISAIVEAANRISRLVA